MTKAIDYYRRLLISKVNNDKEPYIPKKIEGYNSMFQVKNSNGQRRINKRDDENNRNNEEMIDSGAK